MSLGTRQTAAQTFSYHIRQLPRFRLSICHHEFQVQSKSLYQNNHNQILGEFKAENEVLERNYNRATIHHFHLRNYPQSLFIYSALKNKKLDTHFLF